MKTSAPTSSGLLDRRQFCLELGLLIAASVVQPRLANAAASGALLRGAAAGPWLAGCGLGARLVDAHGAGQEVGCWPDRTATPVGPS